MSNFSERFETLKIRDFRLLWIGQSVSSVGTEMQRFAIPLHIYAILDGTAFDITLFGRVFELDAATLGLGAVGLVRVVPIMVFALIGGILADIINRRKLLMVTESISALLVLILGVLTYTGAQSVGLLYLFSGALAATTAISTPTRQSLVPNLVPDRLMTNAVSLNTLVFQIGSITGPVIASLLVSFFGRSSVYFIDAMTFSAAIFTLFLMNYRGKAATSEPFNWELAKEGLIFTYTTKILWGSILLDFFATFFGSAKTMLPAVADQILGLDLNTQSGNFWLGILAGAQPIGAFGAGLAMALIRDVRRQGIVMLSGVALYGVATALFGLSPFFALSYLFFALTGVGDTISMVIRGTLRQVVTPDHLRGRATSVASIFFMGGPQLGELEAGVVAALFGVPVAIFTGGVAVVLLTGWVAWRYPTLRDYQLT
ncbi:MAG: MFS transporter [Chloroflexota bacterium]